MFSKIWLINLLLTAMVMLAGFQAYRAWWGEEKEIPSISPVKETSSTFEKKMYKKKEIPSAEYETVATNNLFAEDRSESKPEEKPKEPDAKPKTDQKLIDLTEKEVEKIALYGVVISESEKKALVSNLEMKAPTVRAQKAFGSSFLKRTAKNEKPAVLVPASSGDKVKWVKKGDQIGKFKVIDIKNDSILLSAEGMEFQVFLYEKKGQKSAAPVNKETGPVIVTVGTGAKSVSAPVKAAPVKQADLIKNIQETLKPKTNVPAGSEPKQKKLN
ncbi:MAG TPA: hypothetical protein HPP90_00575 [Deltaproteobacteria bacterium]|nr:hypothetical protein [Deltaproteobacteria bacterium]